MTPFYGWWADHWPLIPMAIVWTAALIYLVWATIQCRKEAREEPRLVNES